MALFLQEPSTMSWQMEWFLYQVLLTSLVQFVRSRSEMWRDAMDNLVVGCKPTGIFKMMAYINHS